MADYRGSIELPHPVPVVWSYVTDLARTPEWRTTVHHVDPPTELRRGAVFAATTRVLGRTWRWRLRIDRLDPPHVIEYSVVEGFTAIVTTYELAPAGAGCRFTLRGRSTARSLLERAVEPFAARTLRRQADRHLDNLAARLRER